MGERIQSHSQVVLKTIDSRKRFVQRKSDFCFSMIVWTNYRICWLNFFKTDLQIESIGHEWNILCLPKLYTIHADIGSNFFAPIIYTFCKPTKNGLSISWLPWLCSAIIKFISTVYGNYFIFDFKKLVFYHIPSDVVPVFWIEKNARLFWNCFIITAVLLLPTLSAQQTHTHTHKYSNHFHYFSS